MREVERSEAFDDLRSAASDFSKLPRHPLSERLSRDFLKARVAPPPPKK